MSKRYKSYNEVKELDSGFFLEMFAGQMMSGAGE
jgi:hypothetical protein